MTPRIDDIAKGLLSSGPKKGKPDPRFAWSAEDNSIGQTELSLSEYLTKQINERPELGLRALYASQNVQQRAGSILGKLEQKLGRKVKATTTVVREEGGGRKVYVTIE